MDYQKIYNELCNRAKNRQLDGYTETHHIVPKCLGGIDGVENLVELTAREHFIAHKLLHEIYPDNKKLLYAYTMMAFIKNKYQHRDYIITNKEYERLKLKRKQFLSEEYKGRSNYWLINTPRSQEIKDKISKAHKGRTNYWLKGKPGKKHTEETKQKLSEMRKDTQHRGDNHAAKKIKDIDTGVIYNCKLDAIEQLDLSYYQINKKIKLGKFKEL